MYQEEWESLIFLFLILERILFILSFHRRLAISRFCTTASR